MLMLTAYLQLKQNGTLKTPALARVHLKPNGSPSDLTVFHTELRMYWMLTRSILYRSGKNHWQLLKERERREVQQYQKARMVSRNHSFQNELSPPLVYCKVYI